jgi:hypothetical protein
MAKNEAASAAPKESDLQPVAAQVTEAPLTLREFCMRVSETVKSPELIAAFHHVEQASGVGSDSLAAYQQRFDAFRNQPV